MCQSLRPYYRPGLLLLNLQFKFWNELMRLRQWRDWRNSDYNLDERDYNQRCASSTHKNNHKQNHKKKQTNLAGECQSVCGKPTLFDQFVCSPFKEVLVTANENTFWVQIATNLEEICLHENVCGSGCNKSKPLRTCGPNVYSYNV